MMQRVNPMIVAFRGLFDTLRWEADTAAKNALQNQKAVAAYL